VENFAVGTGLGTLLQVRDLNVHLSGFLKPIVKTEAPRSRQSRAAPQIASETP
jgi:hypothetical protein